MQQKIEIVDNKIFVTGVYGPVAEVIESTYQSIPTSSSFAPIVIDGAYPEEAYELSLMIPTAEIIDEAGIIESYRNHLRRMNPIPEPIDIPYARSEPRDYQRRAVAWALTRHAGRLGSLDALDMGTGKTAVAWYAMGLMDVKLALVTPPYRVMDHWLKEFHRHTTQDMTVIVLDHKSMKKKTQLAKDAWEAHKGYCKPLVLIMNHESVWRSPFREWALAQMWSLIVIDESHRMQSAGGKFSMFMHQMSQRSMYRLGLSGFPITNNYSSIYGQFRTLNDKIFGSSHQIFKSRYTIQKPMSVGGRDFKVTLAYQNLAELHQKYHDLSYRVRTDDVLDLPPMTQEMINVELSPKERKIYLQLEREMIADTEAGIIVASNCLAKTGKLRRLCSGHATDEDGNIIVVGKSKIKVFESWIADFPKGEPLVIFAEFLLDIALCKDACEHAGREVGILTGAHDDYTGPWQRREIDTIICQERCGATGLDELQRARYMLTYGCSWSLQTHIQKERRLRRFGQDRAMIHYLLVCGGTKDQEVHEALVANYEAATVLLDGLH